MPRPAASLDIAIVAWFEARRTAVNEPWSNSEWVYGHEGKAYLRWGPKALPSLGQVLPVMVLANIELKARQQGRGWFTHTLLPTLECLAIDINQPLVMENVLNTRLAAFLQRRGYGLTWQGMVVEGPPTFMAPYPYTK